MSFKDIKKKIMKHRFYCRIISKMIAAGFPVTSSDRLVVQNENGIIAYLILADGGEYWWCDDGCCYYWYGRIETTMVRKEVLDIDIEM